MGNQGGKSEIREEKDQTLRAKKRRREYVCLVPVLPVCVLMSLVSICLYICDKETGHGLSRDRLLKRETGSARARGNEKRDATKERTRTDRETR